jgi:hypothetical protein
MLDATVVRGDITEAIQDMDPRIVRMLKLIIANSDIISKINIGTLELHWAYDQIKPIIKASVPCIKDVVDHNENNDYDKNKYLDT